MSRNYVCHALRFGFIAQAIQFKQNYTAHMVSLSNHQFSEILVFGDEDNV